MAYRRNRRKRSRNTNAPPAATRDPASMAQDADSTDDGMSEGDKEDPRAEANETGIAEVADSDDLGKVHTEAIDRYEPAWEKDRENQTNAYDDLKFVADDGAQWDVSALTQRRGEQRPILTINKIPQFIRQVTGDIRQLRPAIHVVPIDERANESISLEVLPEMVRYIERRSDAKGAYFAAADQMVTAGIGHCRIYTEYAADTTMNQEIGVGLIYDGIAVVWDPDSVELTRRDAKYCFVPVDYDRKVAEQKWPDKAFDAPLTSTGNAFDGWASDDYVRVCEYWRKCPIERELAIYPTGQIVDLTDDEYEGEDNADTAETDVGDEEDGGGKISQDEANYREGEGDQRCENCSMFQPPYGCSLVKGKILPEMLCDYFELKPETTLAGIGGPTDPYAPPTRPPLGPDMGPKRADAVAAGATFEKRDSFKIQRFIISGQEVLEGPDEWPGMHIPIVPFLGEETKIGRRTVRRGIVRNLKDPQRLYNYAVSADAEAVALQPKAPFKGTRKNFENFLDQWETANTRNWAFLEYDPDPENGGRPPEREPPPVASTGIKELLAVATADMSAVTGIYPAALGASSNETSGRAITARQREGDTGTFVYVEAFTRAIERVGQIVVDLIPHVYDTERVLRVTGDDGKPVKLEINKPIIDPNGDGIDTITLNDLTVGSYQVAIEMGPSYSTKREEAREGMQVLMQSLGQQVAPLFADLYVQGQDFPLSDKIAKRLQFLLPPQIAQAEAAQSGEPPPPQQPPGPPNPEAQIKGAELQLKQQEVQGKLGLQAQQMQLDQKKLMIELHKVDAELEKARIAQQTSLAQAHADTLDSHAQRFHDMADMHAQRAHEVGMAAMQGAMNGGGNGAAEAPAEPADDTAQQDQINALTNAVGELQQAVLHIAQMLGGGGANSISQAPPQPGAPPPSGPPPGPPMAPFIGEPPASAGAGSPPPGAPPPPPAGPPPGP